MSNRSICHDHGASRRSPEKKRKRQQEVKDCWFEAGRQNEIANFDLNQTFPFKWTEKAIDAAHGLRGGDNDVNTRLWHAPDVPQKPSFLDFLLHCASLKLKQAELNGNTGRGRYSGAKDYHIIKDTKRYDKKGKRNHFKNQPLATEERNRKKRLNSWHESEEGKKMHKKEFKLLQLRFDETAAFALGATTEECVVSSFLPLARRHILRLRTNNSQEQTCKATSLKLSPSEEILQIVDESCVDYTRKSHIPPARPPTLVTRSCVPFSIPTLEQLLSKDFSKGHTTSEQTIRGWEGSAFEAHTVLQNKKIFRVFDSHVRVDSTNTGDETESEVNKLETILNERLQATRYEPDLSFPEIISTRNINL